MKDLSIADLGALKVEAYHNIKTHGACGCYKCQKRVNYWMDVLMKSAEEMEDRIEEKFGKIPFNDPDAEDEHKDIDDLINGALNK